jgi:hypothetical protein
LKLLVKRNIGRNRLNLQRVIILDANKDRKTEKNRERKVKSSKEEERKKEN